MLREYEQVPKKEQTRTQGAERRVHGKMTLSIECDQLLKHDPKNEGTYISRSGEDVAQDLQLETLLNVPLIDEIKIKCFHVCGTVNVQGQACLTTLWSIGDWMLGKYRAVGKSAQCERVGVTEGRDWTEADATLFIYVDQREGQ